MAAIGDERETWERYRPGNDSNAHQELFFRYLPWARAVAREVYRRVRIPLVEWADYANNATVGLLEAMTRFDPSRGIDFMGYAKARVRGAVFNGLRVYLQESSRRDTSARMQDRVDSFEGGGDDDVLGQMISTVAGLGLGFLLDSASAIDAMNSDVDPSINAERHQMDRLLEESLRALPERELLVMTLHYRQHVPFVDIANLLGVTKGRVSQIHKAAVDRMRAYVHAPGVRPARV